MRLTGGRLGIFDVACPMCGPYRHSPSNRVRPVLRIWNQEPAFAGFKCARCDVGGFARDRVGSAIDPAALVTMRADMAAREQAFADDRLGRARRLWSRRHPVEGSVVERYLRGPRAYCGPFPPTIGFLPPTGAHPPAMIAAFGLARENEPGRLDLPPERLVGVQLTLLKPDGSGKAGGRSRVSFGPSAGSPIVIAPPNDNLGLIVAEGLETGLSLWEALGLGVWVAAGAGRMPALADAVPEWIDSVTIAAEPGDAGMRGAAELARRLLARGIHVEVRFLCELEARAA